MELERNEGPRLSLGRDFLVFFLWLVWVVLLMSLELPRWLYAPGFGFVLIYAAWIWSWIRATLFFLLIGWCYASLSVTPAGLIFLALLLSYVLLKLAQFRFMVNSTIQFCIAVFVATLLFDSFQTIFLLQIHRGSQLSLSLFGIMLSSLGIQTILAAILYKPIERWIVEL